jgi:hypothetical protein
MRATVTPRSPPELNPRILTTTDYDELLGPLLDGEIDGDGEDYILVAKTKQSHSACSYLP